MLQCSNISKSFEGKEILSGCSFHLEENEKCALVGNNGTGKSTLLKIIAGKLSADEGSVTLKSGASLGYLAQQEAVDTQNTIREELLLVKKELLDEEQELRRLEKDMKHVEGEALEAIMKRYAALNEHFERNNGYAVQSEVTGILKGLGFLEEEFDTRIHTLSGGQKTRVALGKLLLQNPSLILLDEPTNHLDLPSIEWLEGFLSGYRGTVLIVAHDRYFLDRIVNQVVEIENTHALSYKGNYTAFYEKKRQLRNAALKAYLNQQAEIRHQEEVIRKLKSFNREKSIKRAESREKLLEKTERLERPPEIDGEMKLSITPSIVSGKDVLSVTELSKSYPGSQLFSGISFDIRRGERVALIGMNGTGKTTMLKIITGSVMPDSGSFRLGTNVKVGYYDQEHQILHPEKTLFEEISDAYPDLTNTRIRNTLAAFLFYGDDVFKLVGALSGGERGRISLAKLMLGNANFLILDEPTNHLDITSKEVLENALNEYEGTVFYVSHDRYFINATATRILDLTGKTLTSYPGNYDYYAEKKAQLAEAEGSLLKKEDAGETQGKQDWLDQKAKLAEIRRNESALKKCESEIESLEGRLKEINALLSREEIATDLEQCTKLTEESAQVSEKLDECYARWEALGEAMSQ
ncbi:MAG: ATP-binding cassette domain-containing protein [Lachnospiraceae bacterium]|nr:ATP-binding cassette domain-containing protein [Lachnospiraceae bacterium]